MGQCHYCGSNGEDQPFCSSCQRTPDIDPAAWEGQVLGSHQILRLLGEGPIGMVFEATHVPSSEQVRLKLIDTELVQTQPELVDRASQLAVAATGLHDSLPQIFEEALEADEARFLSVKWVPGQPLSERLQEGPLPPDEACRIVMGLLEALGELHTTGLTHRDVKPENVLIAPEGSPIAVHLLDVGPSLISAQARSGAHYRSPEQAKGDDLIGPGSDIYSVGVVLYHCLSGRRPFESSDYDVLMSQIAIRRPPSLDQLRPDLPAPLLQVVAQALEAAPGDRFRSASDMSEALRDAWENLAAAPPAPEVAAAPVAAAPAPLAAEPGGPPLPVEPAPDELDEVPTTVHPSALRSGPPEPMVAPEVEPEVPTTVSSKPSAGYKVAAILFLILAVAGGGALLYFTYLSGPEPEVIANEQPSETVEEEPAKAPEKSRGRVRVKLTGLPDGAVWYVDGHPLRANPFMAPKGSLTHTIRVEAPGHEPFETKVAFTEDQEIPVEMGRVEGTKAPGGFKAYTSGPGANARRRHGIGVKTSSEEPRSAYADDKAPAQLRKRRVSAP